MRRELAGRRGMASRFYESLISDSHNAVGCIDAYSGMPALRDSITLLCPPCVRTHPVAWEQTINTPNPSVHVEE